MKNKKLLLLLLIPILFLSVNVQAKPVTDVSGSYGLIKCSNDKVNGLSNCAYVQSYGIIGENTTYTMLEKSTTFAHDHVPYAKLEVFTALYLFPNLNYKNGSFYTLNFEYNQGSYVSTIITTLTKANLVVEAFNGSDYVSGGYTDLNFSADYNDTTKSGHISITFKATTDTSSYRIRIQPGVAIWTNTSSKLAQGVRVFLISANVEDNLSDALLNQITNQNEIIINQNQQLIDNSKKATEEQKKTNELIENTDTSESQNKGANFFKNYNENAHGLSGVITAPLKFLQSLTGAKCTPLKFELPFVKKEVQLQCMKSIYQTHFGVFYTLWQTITTGLIAYTVCLNFYKKIRDLQNPENDKIEVLNL